jgi:hypothetical protein
MDPSTRFPPPLARRALDQPDGRCQHRRQESGNNGESRRVATRAPRRSARDGGSRRVDRDGTRGLGDSAARRRLARPAATRAPTAFNRRIEFDTRTDSKHRPTPPCAGSIRPGLGRLFEKGPTRFFFSRPANERESRRVLSD